MNIERVIAHTHFSLPACFLVGYAISFLSWKSHSAVVDELSFLFEMPSRFLDHSLNAIEYRKKQADLRGVNLERYLGICLIQITFSEISKEIAYRFFLERIVLSRIYLQSKTLLQYNTYISSILFTGCELRDYNLPGLPFVAIFFNRVILNVICGLASKRLGLVGSIFIRYGFFFHSWQYLYQQDVKNLIEKVKSVRILDIMHPVRIPGFMLAVAKEVFSPILLIDRLTRATINSLRNV